MSGEDSAPVATSETGDKLSDFERDILLWVEQYWYKFGKFPSNIRTAHEFRISEQQAEKLWTKVKLLKSLEARGINWNPNAIGLSAEQLAVANSLMNFSDTRSQKKKLDDLGVSTQKYQAWLRDAQFQEYLKTRAENLLGDVQHEAHIALIDNIRRGDLGAIKLYYEMTGRFKSGGQEQLNMQLIMLRMVEAVQQYVKDPAALQGIANELDLVSKVNSAQYSAGPPPVAIEGSTSGNHNDLPGTAQTSDQ